MKKKLLTGLTGVAAAVALAGVASTASAMAPPYAICNFKGSTSLTVPGAPSIGCWLTLSVKANCAGDLEIVGAGSVPGAATCSGLYLGGFPWTGDVSSILAGSGTIDTGVNGAVIANDPSGPMIIAGGVVHGLSSNGTQSAECDIGTNITVPSSVVVTGPNNFGFAPNGNPANASFVSAGLDNLGCHLVK